MDATIRRRFAPRTSRPPEPGPRTPRWQHTLALFGLAGVVLNVALLVAGPFLRPDISILHGALSQYALGPWAWTQTVGFVLLGLGSLAIAVALAPVSIPSPWLPIGTSLLALSAAACLGLAAFPMGGPQPVTLLGDAHQTAGTLSVGLQLGALLATALAFRRSPAWRSLTWPGLLLLAIALIGALLTQAELLWPELPIPFGVVMRMVVVPTLVWWTIVAVSLLRHADRPASPPPPGSPVPIDRSA